MRPDDRRRETPQTAQQGATGIIRSPEVRDPWETADGQQLPRLTLAEAVAQLYEWSTEYHDHPELARDFAVMAARLARRLPSVGARSV